MIYAMIYMKRRCFGYFVHHGDTTRYSCINHNMTFPMRFTREQAREDRDAHIADVEGEAYEAASGKDSA